MISPAATRSTTGSPLPAGAGAGLGTMHRRRVPPAALMLGALLAVWIVWYPHSPDLAAQAYRTHLFSVNGFTLWDNNWYAGHYLLDYSVLFPPLGALLGLRAVGAIAVCLSTVMFARLAREHFGTRAPAASALFAIGAAGDLFIGRLTYALGVTFAVAAVLAVGPPSLPAGGAAVTAPAAPRVPSPRCSWRSPPVRICSPTERSSGRAVLGGPAVAVTLVLTLLFSDGGYETFSLTSLLAAAGSTLVLLLLLPSRERLLRTGALLYLAPLVVSYVVRFPMGSNAVRLGALLAPALLIGAVSIPDARRALGAARTGRRTRRAPARPPSRRGRPVSCSARPRRRSCRGRSTVRSCSRSSRPPIRRRTWSYYRPVTHFLSARQDGTPMRIEVAFTSSHWDATVLGRQFDLARGWERSSTCATTSSSTTGRSPPPRTSAGCWPPACASSSSPTRHWIRPAWPRRAHPHGLPYLHEVFASAHWRVFAVAGAQPLASRHGRLTALDADGFTVEARTAGSFLVRVRYTPFWRVTGGAATVGAASDGWTRGHGPAARTDRRRRPAVTRGRAGVRPQRARAGVTAGRTTAAGV